MRITEIITLLGCVVAIGAQSSFDVVSEGQTLHVQAGEAVSFECFVANYGYQQAASLALKLQKQQGEESAVVANTANVEGDFTERVTVEHDQVDTSLEVTYTIKNAQPEDTGNYTCSVGSGGRTAVYQVVVVEDVQEVHLRGGQAEEDADFASAGLMYRAGTPGFVQCMAVGGTPQPRLRLLHNRTVPTGRTTVGMVLEGEKIAMKRVNYVVNLTVTNFVAETEDDLDSLTCEAIIGSDMDILNTKTVSKTIHVDFVPRVTESDCKVHTKNPEVGKTFKMSCRITAKPAPTEITLKNDADGKVTEVETIKLDGDNEYEAVFTFDPLTADDRVLQVLHMRNAVGLETLPLDLSDPEFFESRQDDDGEGGAASLTTSLVLVLLSALLVSL